MSNIVGPVFTPRGGPGIMFPWFIVDTGSMTVFTIRGFRAAGGAKHVVPFFSHRRDAEAFLKHVKAATPGGWTVETFATGDQWLDAVQVFRRDRIDGILAIERFHRNRIERATVQLVEQIHRVEFGDRTPPTIPDGSHRHGQKPLG